jgi:hypothetical protein
MADSDDLGNENPWYPVDWIAMICFGLVLYFGLTLWAFWLPVFSTVALLALRRTLKRF